jgi:hypothetical protein
VGQMMQTMMQNPAMLEAAIADPNMPPHVREQMRTMLANPQVMQQVRTHVQAMLSNPQTVQQQVRAW